MDRRERREQERQAAKEARRMGLSVRRDNLNPAELQQARRKGLELSGYIERNLNIPHAQVVLPEDLAAIALAAYSFGEDDVVRVAGGNSAKSEEFARQIPPNLLSFLGLTRKEFKHRYTELIGKNNYGEGEVANALRSAKRTLSHDASASLEQELGRLYGDLSYFKNIPLVGPSEIQLDSTSKLLKTSRTQISFPLPNNDIVIEYGAGITAMNRMPDQLRGVAQYIPIDSNWFTSQALYTYSSRTGREMPGIITRADGIRSATNELIALGAANTTDLIIASMVFHFAGREETETGIDNGYNLLKPGGVFATQLLETVRPGQVTAGEVFNLAQARFGEPVAFRKFDFTNPAIQENRTAVQAIFKK